MSKERPILMSAPMVNAIRDGRKSQTRRVVKPQPDIIGTDGTARNYKPLEVVLNGKLVVMHGPPDDPRDARYVGKPIECPYGQPGDRLWVRETWTSDTTDLIYARAQHEDMVSPSPIFYRADNHPPAAGFVWRPSIFMPRWASRLTLEVLSVRVERLWNISDSDIEAEGVWSDGFGANSFPALWDSINAKRGYGWDSNPWVWVVEFKAVQP